MVALVATGLMNKHIADELSINAVTVTMHRSGASRSDYDSMPPYSAIIQYLRILVRKVRQKIEADPNDPHLLITESGVGYRLQNRLETSAAN